MLWSAKTEETTVAFLHITLPSFLIFAEMTHTIKTRVVRAVLLDSLASPMPHKHQCHVGDTQATNEVVPRTRTKSSDEAGLQG